MSTRIGLKIGEGGGERSGRKTNLPLMPEMWRRPVKEGLSWTNAPRPSFTRRTFPEISWPINRSLMLLGTEGVGGRAGVAGRGVVVGAVSGVAKAFFANFFSFFVIFVFFLSSARLLTSQSSFPGLLTSFSGSLIAFLGTAVFKGG